MDEELESRVRRIYAAVDAAAELNLYKLTGTVIENEAVTGVFLRLGLFVWIQPLGSAQSRVPQPVGHGGIVA